MWLTPIPNAGVNLYLTISSIGAVGPKSFFTDSLSSIIHDHTIKKQNPTKYRQSVNFSPTLKIYNAVNENHPVQTEQ